VKTSSPTSMSAIRAYVVLVLFRGLQLLIRNMNKIRQQIALLTVVALVEQLDYPLFPCNWCSASLDKTHFAREQGKFLLRGRRHQRNTINNIVERRKVEIVDTNRKRTLSTDKEISSQWMNIQEVQGRSNRLLSFYISGIWYDTDPIKTPRPAVILLLRMYSLLRERVYRAVA
jgi:hypothetical protein